MTATHRMIATTAPTTAQVDLVNNLLLGAFARVRMESPEKADAACREIGEALAGRPCRESSARMVAHALTVVGCGSEVVALAA